MTVSAPLELEFSSNGDGVTTSFPYPVRFLDKTEIVVVLRDADDVDTVQTLNTDYTIAGSSWPSGGNVVFSVAPVSGLKVVRYRQTQAKQVVDLENKAKNNAESVEQQLDRLTMVAQDNGANTSALSSRAVLYPRGYTGKKAIAEPEAGKILGWNADGTAIVNKEPVSVGAAGIAGAIIFSSDTPADVRNYLDLVPGTDVQEHSANLDELALVNAGTAGKANLEAVDFEDALATPVDGTVVDTKLPSYSATTSPSASKMRYQASTSAGAIAGAIQRPVQLKLSERLDAADFNVKADGVTNDTTGMVAALAAMEETGRPLFLPAGVIMVDPDALFIGNGAEGVGSTKNGQKIFGAGASIANAAGTIIRARQAGNILFEVRGIIGGIHLSGIQFDCANLANSGVVTHSMNESMWVNFHISGFKFYGFRQLCREGPAASTGWSAGNSFSQFLIASQFVGDYGAGLDIDGKPLNNYDPHRNTWTTGAISVNRSAGVGASSAMILGFADSNTFTEVDFAVTGAGAGYGVTYNSLTRTAFPQNNFMYGCSVTSFNVIEDGSHVSGTNFLINHTTQDGETLPTHAKIIGFTDVGQWISALQINKDFGDVIWRNRAGTNWWRIRNNSGSGGDNFLNIERSTNGTAWNLCMRFDPSDGMPSFNIPTVGLKKMTVGAPDSGGAGARLLAVFN